MGAIPAPSLESSKQAEILARIRFITQRYRAGRLSAAQFAAMYFLHWQTVLHGARFASRKFKADNRPDGTEWMQRLETAEPDQLNPMLINYLDRYQFFAVAQEVTAALTGWLRGQWNLTLLGRIPRPSEVLRMQVRGTRPVTTLCDSQRMFCSILDKRDAFVFLQHDLEHAYHFFSDPALHQMQRRLFVLLTAVISEGAFRPMIHDLAFRGSFHYLISDMNTHPLHSLQYLRAILVEHFLRFGGGVASGRLTTRARESIAGIFHSLAMEGHFTAFEYAALRRLADGNMAATDAGVIEGAMRRQPVDAFQEMSLARA